MYLGVFVLVFLVSSSMADWECPEHSMACDRGRCVRLRYRCDGVFNCVDESDENECTTCGKTAFMCDNQCRRNQQLCDGYTHCEDGTDEVCETRPELTEPLLNCTVKNGITTRFPWVRCDGLGDCPNGEDEKGCKPNECNGGAFFCDNECHSAARKCDRVIHCSDGSDEANCEHVFPAQNCSTKAKP